MADYENLLDSIDAVIKSNNRREITGQILQNTLHQMVGSLGENYQLAGFATPTLDPNSPDQNVFYITDEAGVYTNFDNITLGAGLSFLMWKNEEWTSKTLDIVTADWVDEHYVSKAFLRKVFQFFDEDGVEIFPNDTESVVDNIKAMCGLWTNEYLSALGLGEGSTIPTTLAALNDVTITNPQDGQALVYDAASLHWVNATIQSGVDMSVVWAALAGATNEQINISHLTTALNDYVTATSLATTLQSYVTTSALATELASYASQSWVETNYVSKAFFNSLFEVQDVNGNAITPNNSGQTTIDRLKILVGAYTEQYLSALGLSSGGGGGGSSTLAGLNDVTITYPLLDGQALIYDAQSSHWVNGAAISMSAVWTALAAATSEQINSSHLTSALSGYVTTSALASELANYVTTSSLATTLADYVTTSALTTTLADYGSKTWIDNNYVSKAFFNRLFQAFAPLAEGQTEPTQVEPNDTTTTIDNIKAMFGLWTEQYLSALGLSAGGGGGYTLNEPLSSINSAALGTPSQANVAIVWNGTAWTYGTTGSSYTLPTASSSVLGGVKVGSTLAIDASGVLNQASGIVTAGTYKSVTIDTYGRVTAGSNPTTLSGYGITDAISNTPKVLVAGGTLDSTAGNYIFSSGSIITATYDYIGLQLDSGVDKFQITAENNHLYVRQNDSGGSDSAHWGSWSQIANISDIPSLSGYATQSWVSTQLGGYLPLSGGTLTGALTVGDGDGGDYLSVLHNSTTDGGILFKQKISSSVQNDWQIFNDTDRNLTFYSYYTGATKIWFNGASNDTPLRIRVNNNGGCYMQYDNTAGTLGWFGYDDEGTAKCYTGNTARTIIHSGNIGSQSVSYATSAGSATSATYAANSTYLYSSDSYSYGSANPYYAYMTFDSINSWWYLRVSPASPSAIKVDRAEQLAATRTIWGQNFNGSANVSGNLSGVGNITADKYLIGHDGGMYIEETKYGGIRLQYATSSAMQYVSLTLSGAVLRYKAPTTEVDFELYKSDTNKCQFTYTDNGLHIYTNNSGWIMSTFFKRTNGYVGIGTTSPSYQLHVAGNIYATGGVTAASDERLKDVYDNISLSVEQIANAPAVRFYWKADHSKGLQAGTLAQYWQNVLPEVVSDRNNELGIQYGVTAFLSVVGVAREVLSQKDEIEMLKNKVKELGRENKYLREEIDRLKVA